MKEQPWITRVKEEHDDLITRISKLSIFLNHSDRGDATHEQLDLMQDQLETMQLYADILRQRLEMFT